MRTASSVATAGSISSSTSGMVVGRVRDNDDDDVEDQLSSNGDLAEDDEVEDGSIVVKVEDDELFCPTGRGRARTVPVTARRPLAYGGLRRCTPGGP